MERDPGVNFFQQTQATADIDLPVFDGVTDRLEIRHRHLTKGQCEAIVSAMSTQKGARINEVILVDNGLQDDELSLLLFGMRALSLNTRLVIQRNQLGKQSLRALNFLIVTNKPPNNLRHLEINHRIHADGFFFLTKLMTGRCFLETFRVQSAEINERGVENLK